MAGIYINSYFHKWETDRDLFRPLNLILNELQFIFYTLFYILHYILYTLYFIHYLYIIFILYFIYFFVFYFISVYFYSTLYVFLYIFHKYLHKHPQSTYYNCKLHTCAILGSVLWKYVRYNNYIMIIINCWKIS